jgi:pilus assembly protein Flp/PilA
VKRFLRALADDRGVTAVEYSVMLGLIALVLLGSAALVGQQTNGMWSSIQTNLTQGGVFK